MTPIRVLLADDHTLVRAGIRALLLNIDGVEVIAEAADGETALHLIESHRPDLALLDIAMPRLSGLDVATTVTRDLPDIRIIILSMHANEEYVLRALRVGAAGYILKDAGPTELEIAIRAVMRNETYLSPAVSKQIVADYVRRVGGIDQSLVDLSPHERLTPRQREILRLIAEGRTTQEIAHLLTISIKTVESHRAQLMERLDIHDIASLVRYAIRMGVVRPE